MQAYRKPESGSKGKGVPPFPLTMLVNGAKQLHVAALFTMRKFNSLAVSPVEPWGRFRNFKGRG